MPPSILTKTSRARAALGAGRALRPTTSRTRPLPPSVGNWHGPSSRGKFPSRPAPSTDSPCATQTGSPRTPAADPPACVLRHMGAHFSFSAGALAPAPIVHRSSSATRASTPTPFARGCAAKAPASASHPKVRVAVRRPFTAAIIVGGTKSRTSSAASNAIVGSAPGSKNLPSPFWPSSSAQRSSIGSLIGLENTP